MTETKLQISKRLYYESYISYNQSISDFHTSLWINPSADRYFRLSHAGFNVFKNTGIEHYVIEIPRFGYENLKKLKFYSDHLMVPYFLSQDPKSQVYNSLIIFDKKIALLSKFYDSFETYLEKASKQDK